MSLFNDFGVYRQESKLKNGVKVVLFYKQASPISLSAIFKSGSKYDPENMPGAAHFLEHMILNGSPEFPSKDLLAEHIESVGGYFGGMTNQTFLTVSCGVAERDDFERIINILKATLVNPLMSKDLFENEKKVVIKEIKRSDSDPLRISVKTNRNLFFKGTSLSHEVLGDEYSISNLKYEDVLKEHKRLFDKSRLIIIVSGDIAIEELTDQLNKLSFFEGNDMEEDEEYIISNSDNFTTSYFDTPQTHISFGFLGPKDYTRESLALGMLKQVIASGRSSRLTKRLRYNRGLVYSVNFITLGDKDLSCSYIKTDTEENKVQEVLDEIILEITDIKEKGITDKELEFVKNRAIKSIKMSMQRASDWANFHSNLEIFTPEKNIDSYLEDLKSLDLVDINKVIAGYFDLKNWKLSLVGKNKLEDIKLGYEK